MESESPFSVYTEPGDTELRYYTKEQISELFGLPIPQEPSDERTSIESE